MSLKFNNNGETMNRLLHDETIFEEKYKDAYFFLLAAELRYECFSLYCRGSHLSEQQKNRFKELLETPACKERWFLQQIGKC